MISFSRFFRPGMTGILLFPPQFPAERAAVISHVGNHRTAYYIAGQPLRDRNVSGIPAAKKAFNQTSVASYNRVKLRCYTRSQPSFALLPPF
jgi:hypothetical protein